MSTFNVPTREEDLKINHFDNLEKGLGFVPNFIRLFRQSDTVLEIT
jgi:hypothetical protein